MSNTRFAFAFYDHADMLIENQYTERGYKFVKSLAETTDDVAGPTVEEVFLAPDAIDHLDWPVVFHETYSEFDKETGLLHVYETTIRRESVSSKSSNFKPIPCSDLFSNDLQGVTASINACTSQGNESITKSHKVYNGNYWIQVKVVSEATHYTDGDLDYFDMTKVKVTWFRNNTNWTAKNAITRWGCFECSKCGGGLYTYLYISPAVNANWINDGQSTTLVYTYSSFPALHAFSEWHDVMAQNESSAYFAGVKKGALLAQVSWK